jgi:hypothetical protein
MKTSPDSSRTLNEGRPVSTTRRALLALGALLAGGRAALAAADESPKPNASAQARLKLAQEALETVRAAIGRGQFSPGERDPISIWSRRRMEARLDLSTTKAERVAAAQENLDEMARVDQIVNRMYQAGQVDKLARMDAEYRRWEAQSWLEHEKA